jgi:glycosyltransferase involved in cell wall biosynthesis
MEKYAIKCTEAMQNAFECQIYSANYKRKQRRTAIIRTSRRVTLDKGICGSALRIVYNSIRLPKWNCLVYNPTHHAVFGARKQIITILDTIPIRNEHQRKLQNYYFKYILPYMVKKATGIFTISETMKLEIVNYYHVNKENVYVIPCGIDEEFVPLEQIKKENEKPYLLVVGASLPHKNTHELLHMNQFWKDDYNLKILAPEGKYKEYLRQTVVKLQISDKVEFIPYVSKMELVKLYQRCFALVYPSIHEGFGMPPLESLACGRPIIISDIPVHREVCGEGAFYIVPGEPATWESAFDEIKNQEMVTNKIKQAQEKIRLFTWDLSAGRLVQALLAIDPGLKTQLL